MLLGIAMPIDGAIVSGVVGTVKASAVLQVPAPAALALRIHHSAGPGASVTPGLTVQVPVPAAQPAAAAEYVVLIRAGWPAAFTQSRYSVAPLTAPQLNSGAASAIAPLGATSVAGPGGAV